MGKPASRGSNNGGKRSKSFGKGDVTPTQVAFIVDQYLLDNAFSETRSAFRAEASSLIAKASLNDAPRGLLSLEAILNEYISLKEQKVMVDHEKVRLEQEKRRVQNLLQGMQSAMNAYNSAGSSAVPSVPAVAPDTTAMALPPTQSSGLTVYKTPIAHPVSTTPSNVNAQIANSSSLVKVCPPAINKRKGSSEAPPLSKRSRGKSTARTVPEKGNGVVEIAQPSSCVAKSSTKNSAPIGSSQNGSGVAKCLFNLSSLVPVPPNTSVPMTPPRENSSQSEKSISPLEMSSANNCSTGNTPEEFTTTRCTVISSKRVTVSPYKQMAYSMERNHCFTTSSSPAKTNMKRQAKRDHVKGRLDFDGSDASMNFDKPVDDHDHGHVSTSESEQELDIFGIDLPGLDVIGTDFSFTDMLREFDLECEEMGYSCNPTVDASVDDVFGSSPESMAGNVGADQLVSGFSSTVTEVVSSQKDITAQGSDSLTAVQSVTRCIKIISPVKTRGSPVQNCSPTS